MDQIRLQERASLRSCPTVGNGWVMHSPVGGLGRAEKMFKCPREEERMIGGRHNCFFHNASSERWTPKSFVNLLLLSPSLSYNPFDLFSFQMRTMDVLLTSVSMGQWMTTRVTVG